MPLLRPLLWLFVHVLYRLRVHGRERIRATGGCLIVCNRVSLLDRIILQAACPRSLTIAPDTGIDSDGIVAALDRGEAVLMFPEGHVTLSGHMLPFGAELDAILHKVSPEVRVIPACTDGLWGSVFSYRGGSIVWKWPRGFRRHVGVMFGEAINPSPGPSPRKGGEQETPPSLLGKGAGGLGSSDSPRKGGEQETPPALLGKGAGGLGSSDPSPRKGGEQETPPSL